MQEKIRNKQQEKNCSFRFEKENKHFIDYIIFLIIKKSIILK